MAEARIIRLHEVMRRRGVRRPRTLTATDAAEALEAARRCARCANGRLCESELRSGGDDFRLFCPNIHYMERLRANELVFD